MTLGARIREARSAADLTQAVLAERLGTTQPVVSAWESDQRVPDTPYVVELARALGVSTDWLLGVVATG